MTRISRQEADYETFSEFREQILSGTHRQAFLPVRTSHLSHSVFQNDSRQPERQPVQAQRRVLVGIRDSCHRFRPAVYRWETRHCGWNLPGCLDSDYFPRNSAHRRRKQNNRQQKHESMQIPRRDFLSSVYHAFSFRMYAGCMGQQQPGCSSVDAYSGLSRSSDSCRSTCIRLAQVI